MVSDRKEWRGREIAEREGCLSTTQYKELLVHSKIDVVCITTSSGSHAQIALDVLMAGKHVLIEKPMAMTSRDAYRLLQIAKEKELTIGVVSQRRFEERLQLVKRVVQGGDLGKLLLIEVKCPYFRSQEYYDSSEWRGKIAEDGGVLMNQGIHSIDLLLWIGGPVRCVYGKIATQTHEMEAEDLGIAAITFENGTFGTIMASTSIQPGFAFCLNVYGEKGTIKLEGSDIVYWNVPGVPLPGTEETQVFGGGASAPLKISPQYHKLQIIDFMNSIIEGRNPAVTGEDGIRTVQLIEAIYQSSLTGLEVTI